MAHPWITFWLGVAIVFVVDDLWGRMNHRGEG
jgi:hypothetical protein